MLFDYFFMLAFTDEVLNSSLLVSNEPPLTDAVITLAFSVTMPCLTLPSSLGPTISSDHKTVLGIPTQSYLEQMLVGIMLSDGTLVKKYLNGGTYLQLAQSIIHLPYLTHVHALYLAGAWCNMLAVTPKVAKVKLKNGTVKEYNYYSFITKSLSSLNTVFSQWYTKNDAGKNIKHVPANIYDILTPVGLAHWLMGDGGWTGKGIHLATNSFTPEDNLRLIQVLKDKFGLHATLHNTNRIYLPVASAAKFAQLCLPYMEPSMMYKVDRSIRKSPASV